MNNFKPKSHFKAALEEARAENEKLESDNARLRARLLELVDQRERLTQERNHQELILAGLRPEVQSLRGFAYVLQKTWWFKLFGKQLQADYKEHLPKPD